MTKTSSPNPRSVSGWAPRVGVFLRERYPLNPVMLALFLQSLVSLGFMTSLLAPPGPDQSWPWLPMIAQSLSVPMFYLLIRIADELKDEEVDRTLFPGRPLARGAVHRRDLVILAQVLEMLLLILNVVLIQSAATWILFSVSAFFIFLMFKWFFIERTLRASLPLALLTHNPSALIISLYLMSAHLETHTRDVLVFALGAWAFAAAWEIGRKIRRPADEKTYVTYSKIWGPRLPALLVVLLLGIGIALQVSLFAKRTSFVASPWIAVGLVVLAFLFVTVQSLRFVLNLERRPSADPTLPVGLSMLLFLAWSWLWHAGVLSV